MDSYPFSAGFINVAVRFNVQSVLKIYTLRYVVCVANANRVFPTQTRCGSLPKWSVPSSVTKSLQIFCAFTMRYSSGITFWYAAIFCSLQYFDTFDYTARI